MSNPILASMMQSRLAGALGPVRQLMQTMRAAQNPQAALTQAIQSNPQYAQLQNILQQYGNDPGRAFREVAQQNGINPDEILRGLM